jgi:hypothetical protein
MKSNIDIIDIYNNLSQYNFDLLYIISIYIFIFSITNIIILGIIHILNYKLPNEKDIENELNKYINEN